MKKKEVCRKCHMFHERQWNEEDEREWNEGMVYCPCDYFKTTECIGGKKKLPKAFQNLFWAIFGWNKTEEDPPEWCQFKEEHIR